LTAGNDVRLVAERQVLRYDELANQLVGQVQSSSDDRLHKFKLAAPCPQNLITGAEAALGVALPTDYRLFMQHGNGGAGFIGEHYVHLWSVEDLARNNREYMAETLCPGHVMFGSDGGGESYCFDTRTQPFRVVMIPFIGGAEDELPVAASFDALIDRLANGPELFR
jgi:hypothetical protein